MADVGGVQLDPPQEGGHVIKDVLVYTPTTHACLVAPSDCPSSVSATVEPAQGGRTFPLRTNEPAILRPLTFPGPAGKDFSCFIWPSKDIPIPCLLCDVNFAGECARTDVTHHLLTAHNIVVNKTSDICCFKRYFEYWKAKLDSVPLEGIAAVVRTNSKSEDKSEDYYLLSDALPEDKELRMYLQQVRLEGVLDLQQQERADINFTHKCLFCSENFCGNREVLFQHMLDDHNFNVGQPDNLVFVNELLDTLQTKLDNLQCLYCERTFRDRTALKEHMRKKQHKKINPQNKIYDRFYVINYLEFGKNWEDVQSEDDREIIPASNSEWDDWEEQSSPVVCLFCKYSDEQFSAVLQHMEDSHGFHYRGICQEQQLNYYSQVKVVNYIRRQIHVNSCVHCLQKFLSHDQLMCHMTCSGHFLLPTDSKLWDQPQYFFPTYENDSFLCGMDDED